MFNDQTEWKLDPQVLPDSFTLFGRPALDLFATRLNYQLPRYVSWIPDPNAVGVDAFTLDWGTQYNYAFPPFSLIPQVRLNLEEDLPEMVLVAPHWPTQFWFPKLTRQLVQNPVILPSQPNIVHLPLFQPRKGTSIEGTTAANGMSLVRESLRDKGISERAQEIIPQSWREGTQKQYRTYLQKWTTFCSRRGVDTIQPSISEVLTFITELFDGGLGYS